ncbi:MAG: YggS family pyridoxal phosphate-dependent enzyme [Burkholderiales bacterium]
MDIVKSTLQAVRERIARAAELAGRAADAVSLLAVSKTVPAEAVRDLARQGQLAFGESYLQEATEKIRALADIDICWHFIGPLQRNKTSRIAAHFDWVHSVDRIITAQRLSAARPQERKALNVCLQVNISAESSKSGIGIEAVAELAGQVGELPGLRLRGLMGIAQAGGDVARQRAQFAQLRRCLDELNRQGLALDTLSMGMTDDMEAAIAEGATIVRVGTALFGSRINRTTSV